MNKFEDQIKIKVLNKVNIYDCKSCVHLRIKNKKAVCTLPITSPSTECILFKKELRLIP